MKTTRRLELLILRTGNKREVKSLIDLTEFQNKVYETTKRLGYIVNKKNTIKQLKEEIK